MIMKRMSVIIVILVTLIAAQVVATDDPHGSLNSIACEQCLDPLEILNLPRPELEELTLSCLAGKT